MSKKITVNQLIAEKDVWYYLYSSNTWSYYCNYKNGDWTKTVRVKRSSLDKYFEAMKVGKN